MFLLAGCLIEKISGRKWDDFVRDEILDPIGLEAYFQISEMEQHPESSLPYTVNIDEGTFHRTEYRNIYHIGAAGCINSSTKNMAKWIALQLNNGKSGNRQIVSEAMLNECHSPQMIIGKDPIVPDFPEINNNFYGLGWFRESYRDRTLVHHGGGIDGYAAMHFFVPDAGFGASILSNGESSPIIYSLMYSMIDLYFGYEPADWVGRYKRRNIELIEKGNAEYNSIFEKAPKETTPTLPLNRYEGVYSDPGYGDIMVILEDESLVVRYNEFTLKMKHICFDSYIMLLQPFEKTRILSQFILSVTGEVEALKAKLEPALEDMIVFIKKP